MSRSCGSSTSSAVRMYGPIGQNVSMALEKENTPDSISRRWMSRAVMSLNTRYPAMCSTACSAEKNLPGLPITTASSSS